MFEPATAATLLEGVERANLVITDYSPNRLKRLRLVSDRDHQVHCHWLPAAPALSPSSPRCSGILHAASQPLGAHAMDRRGRCAAAAAPALVRA